MESRRVFITITCRQESRGDAMAEDPLREMVLEEDFKRAVIGLDAIEIKMVVGQVCFLFRETDNTIIALQAAIQMSRKLAQVHG